MKTSYWRCAAVTILLLGNLLVGAAIAQDDAEQPVGVLWETTSQVSMEGMPYSPPPNKMKLCAAVGAVEPPGSADEERGCVNSDFVRDGSKVTWNSVCAGPPEMTGQGEITYNEDETAYTGAIRYETADGMITIQLSGQQAGPCDNPR